MLARRREVGSLAFLRPLIQQLGSAHRGEVGSLARFGPLVGDSLNL
jgi:hypothetical protein